MPTVLFDNRKKAVRKCDDKTILELEAILNDMNDSEDMEDFLEKNKHFHFTIYRASNVDLLIETIEMLWFRLSPYVHIYASKVPDYRVPHIYHEEIFEAMRQRDEKKVCRVLTRDLRHGAKVVIDSFSKKKKGKIIIL